MVSLDAFLVGALVLVDGIAWLDSARAKRVIVLVRSIATVVNAVADLIPWNALFVIALESSRLVAVEIRANGRSFIGVVTAVIRSIANVRVGDAEVVGALESGFWAVTASRESRRAVDFVRHVSAIAIAIASEVGSDAVARLALEGSVFALEALAVKFV